MSVSLTHGIEVSMNTPLFHTNCYGYDCATGTDFGF
jgi:hypothetical protein